MEIAMKTRHRLFTTLLTAVVAVAAFPLNVQAEGGKSAAVTRALPASKPVASGHIAVDGINYYYEVHGKGEPLLLLHGGLGSIDMFRPVLPALAKTRRVIAVDLHGHGRTALGARDIDVPKMADDIAALMDKLGIQSADALGYSFGGATALRLAIQHPQKVRRLALVSAGFAQDGFYAEMMAMQAQVGAAMAEGIKDTPMYQSYARVAPQPEDFPKLLDQMGAWMRKPYDWSEDVKKLGMPVMLVFGDSDMYRPEHVVRFYQLLGGGLKDAGWQRENMSRNRLAILPDRTHYDIFSSPGIVSTVLPFLDGKSDARAWTS
jgi:pimeloyl-ACP methyl ester carboxylesterase